MSERLKVNDGGGLYDNLGLIDTMLVDCNEIPKAIAQGNYFRFCNLIVQMAQRLTNLKEGVQNDLANRDETIAKLKKTIDQCEGVEVQDV